MEVVCSVPDNEIFVEYWQRKHFKPNQMERGTTMVFLLRKG
jgi:hypothetical protein